MKTSIILPTYNENRSIRIIVEEILNIVPEAEIIIVDDNSPDGTGRIADELSGRHSNIKVIHRKKKLGNSISTSSRMPARISQCQ